MQHQFSLYTYGKSGQPVQMHQQVSRPIHPLDSHSHEEFTHDTQSHEEHPQDFFGSEVLANSHEQPGPSTGNLHHPEATPYGSRQPGPSLFLRLEQPEPYAGMPTFSQQRGAAPLIDVSQPASEAQQPPDVRLFDLERPFEQLEQQADLPTTGFRQPEEPSKRGETLRLGQSHEDVHQEYHAVPMDTNEQMDNQELQLVPATNLHSPRQWDQQVCPLLLASHGAVVEDKQLFIHSLDNFLAALGTRLTVPKIEGEDLDLHLLYKEVIACGGLEQVIQYKRWKEITEAMNILQNYPGASFVLRSHYLSLLYHFEQAYYFGIQGQLLPPPASLPAPSQVPSQAEGEPPYEIPAALESAMKKRKRKMNPTQIFGVDPAAAIGNTVTGAIHRKFEEGYLVSVVVGGEKLTGVIYHVSSDTNVQQFASVHGLLDGVGSELEVPGLEVQLQGKKKRESTYKKDPNAPRRTRTGYNIFYKEQRARMRQLHPEKDKEASRMVIEMWSRLPEEEKSLYIERGQQDRERYRREMLEYQERLKLQSQIGEGSNGVGQSLAEQDMGAYDGSHDYHVTLDSEAEMNTFQVSHSHMLESEGPCGPLPPEQGYHMQEDEIAYIPQAQVPDSEASGGFMESEQAYQMQEGECEFSEDQESNPTSEQAYPAEEDETACPGSEQGYHVQGESGYTTLEQGYQMQEQVDIKYPSDTLIHGSGEQEGSVTRLQPYYQEPEYAYAPCTRQPHVPDPEASGDISPDVSYSVHTSQIGHSHVFQSRSEVPNGSVSTEQQYYNQEGCAPVQQMPVVYEALGVPASSEQVYNGQKDGMPYSVHLQQQKQVLESGAQSRQVPPEQPYQDRYPYPAHLPYPQAYSLSQAHVYPIQFPHAHGFPLHLSQTQALQYGHAFAPHLHQPQARPPVVSGGSASPQQTNHTQDSGPRHPQKDRQTMPLYKH